MELSAGLLDSNIIIAAGKNRNDPSFEIISKGEGLSTSYVNYIEAMGFPELTPKETEFFKRFFDAIQLYPLDNEVAEKAVELRRNGRRKMKLADAVVASTALVHELPLITANTKDFDHIEGLELIDPYR